MQLQHIQGWIDLLVSLKACFSRKDRRIVEKELQEILSAEEIVTLSVRSGFDLLLSAVALPKGSEVPAKVFDRQVANKQDYSCAIRLRSLEFACPLALSRFA